MYLPYVYLIKNKVTGEFYYGSRATNVRQNRTPEEDLWQYYFTSSNAVKKLIAQYGKDSFETSIVFRYGEYDICYWYEQLLIRDSRKDKKCINGTHLDPDLGIRKFTGHGRTPESEAKRSAAIREAKKGKGNGHVGLKMTDKARENMKKGQAHLTDSKSRTMQKTMSGKIRTAEHAATLGNALRGKPWSEARREAQNKRKI